MLVDQPGDLGKPRPAQVEADPLAIALHGPARAAVEVGGLRNDILEATVAGFADPDGPLELIEPYGAQYVERIEDLWDTRPPALCRGAAG